MNPSNPTKMEVQVAEPVPATGSIELTDAGKIRVVAEVDIAPEIVRALFTRDTSRIERIVPEALKALLNKLAEEKAKLDTERALRDALRTAMNGAATENGATADEAPAAGTTRRFVAAGSLHPFLRGA